ncbi:ESPR domain-containing protein [Escherichia coli]|nr:ESPR domain-containing protein [Escherichia coli]
MNKIYSLKYSHITGGLIAVSELSGRVLDLPLYFQTSVIT